MKWIRAKDVADKLGVSLSQARNIMRDDPRFPKAIPLSPKVVVFNEAEVDEWMRTTQNSKREPASV